MKLLLATKNAGKVKDLEALLKGSEFEVCSLETYPEVPDVVEDGETFLENARKKARIYREATGLPTLADDSGLEVDALGGEPGVHSARYAGLGCSDADNLAKLLGALAPFPEPERRSARFRCVLVFIGEDGDEHIATGDCEGRISLEVRGDKGFGYDPVFVHPAFDGLTLGEVSREEKNSVSHRGLALRRMVEMLRNLEAIRGKRQ